MFFLNIKNSFLNFDTFLVSLDRGRENIENQERETMKRVYELRKTIALENRKKNNLKSVISQNT